MSARDQVVELFGLSCRFFADRRLTACAQTAVNFFRYEFVHRFRSRQCLVSDDGDELTPAARLDHAVDRVARNPSMQNDDGASAV